jgi:hypothetical protein
VPVLREVRLRVLAAFRAAAERLRVVAAFFPAAMRFGDFRVVALRAVVRFLVVAAFRAAVLRLRVVAAFFAALVLFRVVAALLPAATRFGDFRVVEAFFARVVEAFFAAVGRFRVVALPVALFLEATVRLRVVAFALAAVAALRAAVDRRAVAGLVIASSIGPPVPVGMVSDRGVGRSHAGVSGRQDGSGMLGASRAPFSTSFACSELACSELSGAGSSASFQRARSWDQSFVVRSSDDGMPTSSARGSDIPLPDRAQKDACATRRSSAVNGQERRSLPGSTAGQG